MNRSQKANLEFTTYSFIAWLATFLIIVYLFDIYAHSSLEFTAILAFMAVVPGILGGYGISALRSRFK